MNPEDGYGISALQEGPSPACAPINGLGGAVETNAKVARLERDISYIENAPEKAVVLSRRLRILIGQVGGCQTSQVEALVQRILYEAFKK